MIQTISLQNLFSEVAVDFTHKVKQISVCSVSLILVTTTRAIITLVRPQTLDGPDKHRCMSASMHVTKSASLRPNLFLSCNIYYN